MSEILGVIQIHYVILDLIIVDKGQKPLVIIFWKKVNFSYVIFLKKNIETDKIHILLEPIWYNNNVNIYNKYVFCKALFEKGFHISLYLIDTQSEFFSYERITDDYSLKIPLTMYEG